VYARARSPGGAGERGREEQRLALDGRARDDALEVGAEAHVHHPVGLVEDEDPDAAEVDVAPVHEVEQAARGGDEQVGAAGVLRLALDADAAVDGGDGQALGLGDVAGVVDDLAGELTRGGEDERGGPRVAGLQALEDREDERERLAGAGGRLGEDVVAGQRVGDDERLDREGFGDAAAGEGARSGRRHAEIGERSRGHMGCCSLRVVREI
jgi:hypothetical protein